MQPCPDSGVDDLVTKIVRHVGSAAPRSGFQQVRRGRTREYRGRSGLCREMSLNTSAIADVIVQCAQGYSGWLGVVRSGRQPGLLRLLPGFRRHSPAPDRSRPWSRRWGQRSVDRSDRPPEQEWYLA